MFKTHNNHQNYLFSNLDLRHLILPLIVQLALQLIVGLIDSVMVASVGEAAVSGVSLVDSIMQLIIYIFSALAAGAAVVAGQYLGAKNQDKAKQAANELLWLNVWLSIVIMVAILLASNWILTNVFGNIAADVFYQAERYFYVVTFSIPAIAIFEAGTSIFRTMNNSKTTMKISVLMNVINAVGNAILIYGCGMGTQGAAIATLVSRWIAAILIIQLLLNPKWELSIERKWIHHFDLQMTKSVLAMGVPGGIENSIFQLGKIAILSLVATFGTSAITANAVTQTMASLEMIPGSAIQLAMITINARCVGTGDYEQVKYYNRKLIIISYVAILCWSIVLLLLLPSVLSLYNLTIETANLTTSMFLWHAFGAVLLWPLSFNLPASLRAAGDVRFPMMISILSMWVFRFVGAYILSTTLGLGAVGVWIAMAMLDWGFRSLCYCIRWHNGKWKTKRISE